VRAKYREGGGGRGEGDMQVTKVKSSVRGGAGISIAIAMQGSKLNGSNHMRRISSDG